MVQFNPINLPKIQRFAILRILEKNAAIIVIDYFRIGFEYLVKGKFIIYKIRFQFMHIRRIKKIIEHSIFHKTFFFDVSLKAEPGQFVMVWIPGVDEVPMSLSYIHDETAITVEKVGDSTSVLHSMKVGDKIGLRGAYGTSFKSVGKKAFFIAGGTGIAPLMPLIRHYKGESHVIIGAKAKRYLLFMDELQIISELSVSTDDGSMGFKGLATDLAKTMLTTENYDVVYACGPEPMTFKLMKLCLELNIPMQASLERYMKCGVGICDSCAINGYHVCTDGPVFDIHILAHMRDFGGWKRTASGKRVAI